MQLHYRTALTLAFLLPCSLPAAAQTYPTQTVRVINASAAGGIADIVMRPLIDELRKRWGQSVIMENKPGASFNIGARECAVAPPDGYTICILHDAPFTQNPFLFKRLPFDPETGFTPITNLFFVTQTLGVNSSLGAKSLEDLARIAKAKPGTLSYSTPGLGQMLFIETWFNKERGTDMVRIPFKGGGPAVNDVLSGSTPITFLGLGNLYAHLESGTVTGLVIDGKERSSLFPNIPTLTEIGYKGDVTQTFFGLFAPAGVPKPIIQTVRDTVAAIVADPEFKNRVFVKNGLEAAIGQPDEFAAFLREQRRISERIVKASGLQPQ
jgi:tripartite-type tricarboxylate transporter receptor subunit TctC